jgi:4-diphosphocytidyl-2-C-methyl-D-erythritol kinase
LTPAPDLRLVSNDPALAGPDNLAMTALARLRREAKVTAAATLRLVKNIPTAAGLGGASSDAAAALLAARRLWQAPVSDQALVELATDLGSDVPFFLRGGTALATGRGELIQVLPALAATWFVVVVPDVVIPRKTETLYRNLTPSDWSSGARVLAQAERLRAGAPLAGDLLGNAFCRPLLALCSDLAELPARMRRHGATDIALSGAGPAHYAVFANREEAGYAAAALAADLGPRTRVLVAAPVAESPAPAAT